MKVKRPSVVGLPVMPPEATPWVNSVRPGGICPATTLNWTGFSDVRQPVVEKNHVFSVPTFPSAKVSGMIVQVVLVGGGAGVTVMVEDLLMPPAVAPIVDDWLLLTLLVETVKVALVAPAGTVALAGTVAAAVLLLDNDTTKPPEGAAELRVTVPVAELPPITVVGLRPSEDSDTEDGGGELTVQPERRAVAAVAEPSLTSTVQSAGAVKPLLSILNLPPPSLVPMATPSTVIVRLGLAWPSIRSCVPLSSAREMLTAACAAETASSAPIRTSTPTTARRA
jgi:hypothetical protein